MNQKALVGTLRLGPPVWPVAPLYIHCRQCCLNAGSVGMKNRPGGRNDWWYQLQATAQSRTAVQEMRDLLWNGAANQATDPLGCSWRLPLAWVMKCVLAAFCIEKQIQKCDLEKEATRQGKAGCWLSPTHPPYICPSYPQAVFPTAKSQMYFPLQTNGWNPMAAGGGSEFIFLLPSLLSQNCPHKSATMFCMS